MLKPTEGLFTIARMMFEDLWNHRLNSQKTRIQSLTIEMEKIDKSIGQLLDWVMTSDSASVIRAYENRIKDLEVKKMEVKEKIAFCGKPARGFDEIFRTALEFLGKPYKLWHSDRLEDKRAVLKLTFSDRLADVQNEGFRTAKTTLPFKVLAEFKGGQNRMARPRGFKLEYIT